MLPDSSPAPRLVRLGLGLFILMFINRPSFFTPLANACLAQHQPVHQVDLQGVPLLCIFELDQPLAAQATPGGQVPVE